MIVRTTAALGLAAISLMAMPSAGFCEVKALSAESAGAALFLPSSGPDVQEASNEAGPLALGQPTLSAGPQEGVPEAATAAAPDLRGVAMNTVTEPPQSLWSRLMSAVIQLGAAR